MAEEKSIYDLAHAGDFQELSRRLEEDPNLLTKQDNSKRILIHWAVLSGNIHLVNHLFELGSPVDPLDDTEMTPLILASSAGKIEVVKILLANKANVNQKNEQGHSPLQYASSKGWAEIVKLLLDNEADVNIADRRGATPLHRAASKGNIAVVKLLLSQKSIQVDYRDFYGCTALHLACEEDRQEEAKLLVEHGAQTDIRNKEKKTPLDLCTMSLRKLLTSIVRQSQ